MTEPIYFESPAAFRAWLADHHATDTEVWVGYWKKATGRPSLTWTEAVQEALCYGWIDSVARRIDDERHQQRFTPRKKGSIWSNVNIKHVARLIAEGRMTPAGLAAYEARRADRTGIYAFEIEGGGLSDAYRQRLEANAAAWTYFQAQAPSYRKTAEHWVTSAKQEATREKRLATLIASSAAGEYAPPFKWAKERKR